MGEWYPEPRARPRAKSALETRGELRWRKRDASRDATIYYYKRERERNRVTARRRTCRRGARGRPRAGSGRRCPGSSAAAWRAPSAGTNRPWRGTCADRTRRGDDGSSLRRWHAGVVLLKSIATPGPATSFPLGLGTRCRGGSVFPAPARPFEITRVRVSSVGTRATPALRRRTQQRERASYRRDGDFDAGRAPRR